MCTEGYYRVNLSTSAIYARRLHCACTDESEDAPAPIDGQRGWSEEVRKRISSFREVRLPVAQLKQNMNQFLQLVGRLFKQVDQQIGAESDMKLDEVERLVEISGEGEVKLVAGGKAAGKGAIKLKIE